MTELDQENYDELKQQILEYLQMLPIVKDDEEQFNFIQRRISFNVKLMLYLKNKN